MKSRMSAKRAGKRGVKDLPVSGKAKDTTGGKGKKGGSWYEALAKALGEAANKQAE
jgi:hypothetical protein